MKQAVEEEGRRDEAAESNHVKELPTKKKHKTEPEVTIAPSGGGGPDVSIG